MKKLAFAAAALVGVAAIFSATQLDAKGGFPGFRGSPGFRFAFRPAPRPNIGPLARPARVIAHNIGPLAGRHFADFHRHRHNGDGTFWWGGGYYYPDAVVIQTNQDAGYSDAAPVPPPVAQPVIRTVDQSQSACGVQHVTVPATGGGETTVNIIRC